MFKENSLVTRIAVGKLVGFAVGLFGFIVMPFILPTADLFLRWGILLWYTTIGGIIGLSGVMIQHPLLNLPMPWWFTAPLLGAWMNFVLTLFAYKTLQTFMDAMFGVDGMLTSPFWFTLEGGLVGLLIGFLATRFGGEGKEIVEA
jgi:hypothetical protein